MDEENTVNNTKNEVKKPTDGLKIIFSDGEPGRIGEENLYGRDENRMSFGTDYFMTTKRRSFVIKNRKGLLYYFWMTGGDSRMGDVADLDQSKERK